MANRVIKHLESDNSREESVTTEPVDLIQLPLDREVVAKVRETLHKPNIRIAELQNLISEDVALCIEIISAANNKDRIFSFYQCESVRAALFRLGSEEALKFLDTLENNEMFYAASVTKMLSNLRLQAQRTVAFARIISATVSRGLIDDVMMASFVAPVGHMLACIKFGEDYIGLSQEYSKAGLAYRLWKDYNFDVEQELLEYLENKQFPHSLSYVYDKDFKCKTQLQANLKFLVKSAIELGDAYDSGKWNKYNPVFELPKLSTLRLLQINKRQHRQIFDECSELLKGIEELPKKGKGDTGRLFKFGNKVTNAIFPEPETLPAEPERVEQTKVKYIETSETECEDEIRGLSKVSKEFINQIREILISSHSTEEVLVSVLNLLVSDNAYKRASLLVVRSNRKSAIVYASAGDGISHGNGVAVEDQFSPIAMCTNKVRSFNSPDAVDLTAPFGVSAYAVSPIKAKGDHPILLYADCGGEKLISMELRKLFRIVIGLLNARLPSLSGSLDIEDMM